MHREGNRLRKTDGQVGASRGDGINHQRNIPCKYCQSTNTVSSEKRPIKDGFVFRYKCRDCKRRFSISEQGDTRQNAEDGFNPNASFEDLGNEALATSPREGNPPTLKALFQKFAIDPKEWKVLNFKINEWQQHSGKHGVVSLYQGKATLLRSRPVTCEWPVAQPVALKPIKANKAPATDRKVKKAIIIGDAQVGFFRSFDDYSVSTLHDLSAFACATQAIMDTKPDVLVLLGDMLDLPDWSDHFIQSPEYAFSTQMSINWLASWMAYVRPFCGEMVYLEGNHEKRLVRNLMTNCISSFKLRPANMPASAPMMSVESMLNMDSLNATYVDNYPKNSYWLNRNLRIIHGTKIGAKSGQTAMKMVDQLRASLVQGHVHRQESAHVTVHDQDRSRTHGAYSLGTLSRIDGAVPSGASQENWQQGFAVVDYTEDLFQMNLVNIWGGKYLWDGVEHQAIAPGNNNLSPEYVKSLLQGAAIGVGASAPEVDDGF